MKWARWVLVIAVLLGAGVVLMGATETASPVQDAAAKARADQKRQAAQLAASEFVTVLPAKRVVFPAWTGKTLDGKPWSTASLKGRVTVVNFWASWCGPCEEEWPALQQVASSRKDVVFLGINSMDQQDRAKAFLVKNAADYPQVFDVKGEIMASWKSIPHGVLPTTVIVDSKGRIAAWKGGPLNKAQLQRGINAVLKKSTT